MQAGPEHLWLHKLVGGWRAGLQEGQMEAAETFSKVGENWVIGEGQIRHTSGEIWHYRIQLGFDRSKGKFVGSWVGSMMDTFWVYEGELEGDTLTLNSVGPDWSDPSKMVLFQDIYKLLEDGSRTLTSRVQQEDGSWHQFMHESYFRV